MVRASRDQKTLRGTVSKVAKGGKSKMGPYQANEIGGGESVRPEGQPATEQVCAKRDFEGQHRVWGANVQMGVDLQVTLAKLVCSEGEDSTAKFLRELVTRVVVEEIAVEVPMPQVAIDRRVEAHGHREGLQACGASKSLKNGAVSRTTEARKGPSKGSKEGVRCTGCHGGKEVHRGQEGGAQEPRTLFLEPECCVLHGPILAQ